MSGASVAALVLAMVSGLGIERARRHRRLNEGLHELRRPLQAITTAACGDGGPERDAVIRSSVEAAAVALADLDCAVNGRTPRRRVGELGLGSLLEGISERWSLDGRVLLEAAPAAIVSCDADRIGAALDNLIANGLEHGRGPVRVGARVAGRRLRLEVRSGKPVTAAGPGRARDPRRGHGLRLASRVAERSGGVMSPPRPEAGGGFLTALELPLTSAGEGR